MHIASEARQAAQVNFMATMRQTPVSERELVHASMHQHVFNMPRFQTGDRAGQPVMTARRYVREFIDAQGD
jgi:hypothetical protein